MSFLKSKNSYLSIIKEELKKRIRKHKKWYAFWMLINTLIPQLLFLFTLNVDIARRAAFLTAMIMVFADEYLVMGHKPKLRDLFGYYDKEKKKYLPTHEAVAFILFLLSLI